VPLLHLNIQHTLLFVRLGNKTRALFLVGFEFPEALSLQLYVEQPLLLRLARFVLLLLLLLPVQVLGQVRCA
jgi:hypothetical protein